VSTVATPQMRKFAADWETKCGLGSANMSGIVGDLSHKARGGYHISRMDQVSPSNYSVVRPDDKSGPSDAAAAVDMTLNPVDMKKCTTRLKTAFNNPADPRRKYMNAFNGWTGDGNAQRWDVYARKISAASADHKWHVHLEIRRRYVNSDTALAAVLSVLKGESVAMYLRSIGVTIKVGPKAPIYPGRILKRNDAQAKPDASVKLFQVRMLSRGWVSLGKADGFYGAKLESVVKRWQVIVATKPDGMIGPKTWPTPWTRPLGK
jgi:peptidoglycan hydrolase-like protein with peptidoglycan-binding domain